MGPEARMRGVCVLMALLLTGCADDGAGPELIPDYKLSHLTGTWQGDSECEVGRYRIRFDSQIPGTGYLTGQATLSTENAAGQCVETRTEPVTAHVVLGGGVTVYWPLVGAPVHDRLVYTTYFTDLRTVANGRLTLEGSPSQLQPPGRFAMKKQ